MGGTYLIQSVPAELNMDHTVVLQLAEVGCVFESAEGAAGVVPTSPLLGPCAKTALWMNYSGLCSFSTFIEQLQCKTPV